MTMQHDVHPHDERLAALAGNDPDVAGDAVLRAHVDSCDRCGPMVADLARLQAALAELPDLVPSRPIQLLPPVPEPVRTGAPGGGRLRRLWAPVMAVGAGLALVGAVGLSGFVDQGTFFAASGGAPQEEAAIGGGAAGQTAVPGSDVTAEDHFSSPGGNPETANGQQPTLLAEPSNEMAPRGPRGDVAVPDATEDAEAAPPTVSSRSAGPDLEAGWLAAVVVGVGLMAVGLFLRFGLQPRAG
ncbi:MAG TPA: hypothetical protein VFH63_01040 [candidate division Zixibacteria bacterium]|nr:hypothetical protein [candidate division Zixibacteria bacterium]